MSVTIATLQKYILPSTGPYTDDFQAYSIGDLAGQGDWVNSQGAMTIIDIAGDKVVRGNSSTISCNYVNKSFPDDQYAQVTLGAVMAGVYVGAAVRCSSGGNWYGWYVASNACYIMKEIAGVRTQLDSAVATFNANDVLYISVIGTTIKCLCNGVPVSGIGDGNGELTDSSLSSGAIGVMSHFGSDSIYFDDFEGTAPN